MNYNQSIGWLIQDIPSSTTVICIGHQHIDLYEDIPSFAITLPICLSDTVERIFPGGTFMSLLQMIYEFYQEVVSSEELNRIMNLSAFNRNRMISLIERQEAGAIIRWINVVGTSSTFEGIRDNLLLVDM
jgi:hypothetical protein